MVTEEEQNETKNPKTLDLDTMVITPLLCPPYKAILDALETVEEELQIWSATSWFLPVREPDARNAATVQSVPRIRRHCRDGGSVQSNRTLKAGDRNRWI
jgi:hypothetical protein